MSFFLPRHSSRNDVLDTWFVGVSIHWLETDHLHQIVCLIDGNYIYNFSEQLEQQNMMLGGFSKQQLIEALKGLAGNMNRKI